VGWTTFGSAIAPIFLLGFGLLLAGSSTSLNKAISADPIGALTTILPTWYLFPFAIVAVLGLVGGAVLDIYSSGLTLLAAGLRAPRYVAAMGGIDRVVELARVAVDSGDYRWAATLLDHAVFTDSQHAGARGLYADTLEQLAYGAENATWRNFFMSGATELRDGNFGTAVSTTSTSMLSQLTPEQIFDSFALRVDGPRSWDLDIAIDISFADVATNYRLTLRNGVLVYRKVAADAGTANVTVVLDNKIRLLAVAMGDATSPGLQISGDPTALQSFLSVLEEPDQAFNIVTP